MKATLQIYSEDGTLKIFDKYTLYHFGFVRNRKTGQVLHYRISRMENTIF